MPPSTARARRSPAHVVHSVLAVSLVAFSWGCGPDAESRITGTWVVDVDRWLADPSLIGIPANTEAALVDVAGGLVTGVEFAFEPGRCTRRIAGRSATFECRVHDVEQETVVLRLTLEDDAVEWVRMTPEPAGARVTWGGRTMPVRRVSAAADDRPTKK